MHEKGDKSTFHSVKNKSWSSSPSEFLPRCKKYGTMVILLCTNSSLVTENKIAKFGVSNKEAEKNENSFAVQSLTVIDGAEGNRTVVFLETPVKMPSLSISGRN